MSYELLKKSVFFFLLLSSQQFNLKKQQIFEEDLFCSLPKFYGKKQQRIVRENLHFSFSLHLNVTETNNKFLVKTETKKCNVFLVKLPPLAQIFSYAIG